MKNLNYNRVKLFDGLENELFDKDFLLEIENKKVVFIADDLTPNKLANLTDRKLFINELDLTFNNIIIHTKDRLQVYYLKEQELLIVFSLGEYQPARYMLFLEGVWEL